jgi:hypothetical protein
MAIPHHESRSTLLTTVLEMIASAACAFRRSGSRLTD